MQNFKQQFQKLGSSMIQSAALMKSQRSEVKLDEKIRSTREKLAKTEQKLAHLILNNKLKGDGHSLKSKIAYLQEKLERLEAAQSAHQDFNMALQNISFQLDGIEHDYRDMERRSFKLRSLKEQLQTIINECQDKALIVLAKSLMYRCSALIEPAQVQQVRYPVDSKAKEMVFEANLLDIQKRLDEVQKSPPKSEQQRKEANLMIEECRAKLQILMKESSCENQIHMARLLNDRALILFGVCQQDQEPITMQQIDDKQCQICLDKPKTHVAVPCGHFVYCNDCKDLIQKDNQCLICRQPVIQILKIFQ